MTWTTKKPSKPGWYWEQWIAPLGDVWTHIVYVSIEEIQGDRLPKDSNWSSEPSKEPEAS